MCGWKDHWQKKFVIILATQSGLASIGFKEGFDASCRRRWMEVKLFARSPLRTRSDSKKFVGGAAN